MSAASGWAFPETVVYLILDDFEHGRVGADEGREVLRAHDQGIGADRTAVRKGRTAVRYAAGAWSER